MEREIRGMTMKVFISGPITDTTDYEERFREADDEVGYSGHDPINPIDLCKCLDGKGATHEKYMNICFGALRDADAIYMLRGWENSKGSCMEYGFARAMGIRIIEQEAIE